MIAIHLMQMILWGIHENCEFSFISRINILRIHNVFDCTANSVWKPNRSSHIQREWKAGKHQPATCWLSNNFYCWNIRSLFFPTDKILQFGTMRWTQRKCWVIHLYQVDMNLIKVAILFQLFYVHDQLWCLKWASDRATDCDGWPPPLWMKPQRMGAITRWGVALTIFYSFWLPIKKKRCFLSKQKLSFVLMIRFL